MLHCQMEEPLFEVSGVYHETLPAKGLAKRRLAPLKRGNQKEVLKLTASEVRVKGDALAVWRQPQIGLVLTVYDS